LLFLLLLLPFSILAQNTLSGTVLDKSSGQPIQVNVNVQGSTNGVSTDFESFNCQMLRKALKSFFFHWLQNTVIIWCSKSVTVSLEEDANQLMK
jgi:iron complex outermembrane receptor protein